MIHPLKNLRTQWHTQIPLARKELSFFISHWGKTRSMVAMSKKLQYHGLEELHSQNPWVFWLFFIQYLVRDSLIYIAIPIFIATFTV